MTLTYDEAVAQVVARGQLFEVAEAEVLGVRQRIFRHAPPTLRELFQLARGHGERTFLVYEDERWSFAEVMAAVDGFAAALVDRYGIGRGDRVAIGMRNYPEWVVAFAAVTSVGAISVSLNAWWTEDELAFALEDCGARVLVADRERVERTRGICSRLGVRVVGVRLPAGNSEPAGNGEPAGADEPRIDRWEDVVERGAPLPDVAVGADDDATILYTSGTTGRPKGAVSTHRAITQALFGFAARSAVERVRRAARTPVPDAGATDGSPASQAFILIVPLFHVTGCVPVMLACFGLGMKLVMMYRWEPERALELIERERVTAFVGVPTQSWDLLESPRFADFDTSSLRSIGGGGAPAPPALVHRVADAFRSGSPTIGYGMTETNAFGPGNTGDDYVTHPTSTGRAGPTMQVSIRDPLGHELPVGRSGEIWLKGPNLIRGYWNRPDATAEALVDGWMRTGDLGHLDDEGFVYVEDRIKDMILRAGENVYSAEVEAAIYEHPAVYEAAVFGVPHERLGEEVAAVVVTKPGVELAAADLQAFVGERLASFKVPTRVAVVSEPLPRNAAGKVLKRELRSAFGA
jgi:long-chain acyl-CoA synthetase